MYLTAAMLYQYQCLIVLWDNQISLNCSHLFFFPHQHFSLQAWCLPDVVPECDWLLLDVTVRKTVPAKVVVAGVVWDGWIRGKRTRQPANLSGQNWNWLSSGLAADTARWFWRNRSSTYMWLNHLTQMSILIWKLIYTRVQQLQPISSLYETSQI